MNYISISDVEAITVGRATTGQDELDWLYGMSEFSTGNTWGMPVGKISTWVGEGGVGKSRLAINVAKNKVKEGKTVLYLQNEVDLPTLASWVNDDSLENFYCSETTDLSNQIKAILELSPDFVFVDSINLIDGYNNGNDRVIREIAHAYRQAIKGTQTHVVFLCQLNKDGSAKGSSSLKHLPDTQFLLTNEPNGCFKVSFGTTKPKHRYGRVSAEYHGIWKHNDHGVEAISSNRLQDSRWPEHISSVNNPDYIPGMDNPHVMTNVEKKAMEDLVSWDKRQGIKLARPGYSERGVPNSLKTCSPAVKKAVIGLKNPAPVEDVSSPGLFGKLIAMYKKNWSK